MRCCEEYHEPVAKRQRVTSSERKVTKKGAAPKEIFDLSLPQDLTSLVKVSLHSYDTYKFDHFFEQSGSEVVNSFNLEGHTILMEYFLSAKIFNPLVVKKICNTAGFKPEQADANGWIASFFAVSTRRSFEVF